MTVGVRSPNGCILLKSTYPIQQKSEVTKRLLHFSIYIIRCCYLSSVNVSGVVPKLPADTVNLKLNVKVFDAASYVLPWSVMLTMPYVLCTYPVSMAPLGYTATLEPLGEKEKP